MACVFIGALTMSWFVAGALIAPSPSFVGDPPNDLRAISIEIESNSGSVIESVYTEIGEAIHNRAAIRLGPFAYIPSAILRVQLAPRLGIATSQLRPIDHVSDVGCPVYIVSGREDIHTTTAETEALFLNAPNPKELWLVESAGHVDLLEHSSLQYRERIGGFFERKFKLDHTIR